MKEEEKIIKARRQLIVVGVVCVAVVVLVLWLVSLPRTLERNRTRYSPTTSILKQLQELWKK